MSWRAPFTLNITNKEPDVTYCVCMINMSNEIELLSVCNITENEFIYTLTNSVVCYENVIKITVTPVNEVGNGRPDTVKIHCMCYNYTQNII